MGYLLMLNWGLIGLGIGYLTGQTIVAIIVGILMWRMMNRNQFERSESPDDRSYVEQ